MKLKFYTGRLLTFYKYSRYYFIMETDDPTIDYNVNVFYIGLFYRYLAIRIYTKIRFKTKGKFVKSGIGSGKLPNKSSKNYLQEM